MACEVVLKDGTRFIGERKFVDVALHEGMFERVYRVTKSSEKFSQGQLLHIPSGSLSYVIELEDEKEKQTNGTL